LLVVLIGGASTASAAAANAPVSPEAPASAVATGNSQTVSKSGSEPTAEPVHITTKTIGKPVAISPRSKVWVEWKDGALLGKRLEELLRSKGIQVAATKEESDALLRVEVAAGMHGGPKLGKKGVNVNVSRVFDESQGSGAVPVDSGKETSRVGAVGLVLDGAMAGYWMNQAVSPLMRGIGIQPFILGLVEASGLGSWVNGKFGMDPRGICISGCENWSKMEQVVIFNLSFKDNDGKANGRVTSEAYAVLPVLDRLLNEALLQLDKTIVLKAEPKT
jgi:hypothetical protein